MINSNQGDKFRQGGYSKTKFSLLINIAPSTQTLFIVEEIYATKRLPFSKPVKCIIHNLQISTVTCGTTLRSAVKPRN